MLKTMFRVQIFKRSLSRASSMFCYQCEQTEGTKGCTTVGICGKTPETSKIQDILLYSLIGLSTQATKAHNAGIDVSKAERHMLDSLFATMTNVNFSSDRIADLVKETQALKKELEVQAGIKTPEVPNKLFQSNEHPADWDPSGLSTSELLATEGAFGVQQRTSVLGATVSGLNEFLMTGMKGTAAYAHHSAALGKLDTSIPTFIREGLAFLGSEDCTDVNKNLAMLMKCGETNVKTMAGLDGGHVSTFGQPTPVSVNCSAVKGKCILVSGHDLLDLRQLLEETQGLGINVYTHGEMLPAHAYPELRKFPHLVGNYGSAWQNQKFEFASFPGSILMTSNCIIEPRKSYKNRIFTTSVVGFDGVAHCAGAAGKKDFSKLIQAAQDSAGFTETDTRISTVMTGFSHAAILGLADTVVGAVKDGKIKKFMVVGGCDGSESERSYFKDVVANMPATTCILTLGCGKYRFNKLDLGNIPDLPIPRVLDMGQCNDAYGAVVVALKLAEVFKTDVNGLPLSLCISWFEQKSHAVLLSLLYLGVKNITLGPELPAFLTPESLKVVVDMFGLKKANTENPMADVQRFIAGN